LWTRSDGVGHARQSGHARPSLIMVVNRGKGAIVCKTHTGKVIECVNQLGISR
jgi:hypothetical protein